MVYWILIIIVLLFIYFSEFNTFRKDGFNVKQKDSVQILTEVDKRVVKLKKYLDKKYGCKSCHIISKFNMAERSKQLEENYDTNNIYEISPNNLMGNTSFTQQKKKMVFCLRNKSGELHDINTIMFVVLHEITHMMNDRWGHEQYFWELFQVILVDSVDCGIYTPIDYSKYPQQYCGIMITQNPYFSFSPHFSEGKMD